MKNTKARKRLAYITEASAIAALYTVITIAIGPLGSAAIQCRIPEAMCILAIFTPAAIPGMTIGCLISNIATGCLWQDVLFGTLATLIGVIGARLLRRIWWLTPLPTVVSNTLIVPFVLAYAYHAEEGIPFLMLTVGIGEVISAYVLGIALYFALRKNARYIFKNTQN
ncbi:MAG: QueT transporter family protein [Clostridia bacterium]|nr:QueT transporter family protein [Clostridia bacterium]